MRKGIKYFVLALVALSLPLVAQAQRCENFFIGDPFLKHSMPVDMARLAVRSVESLQNSTTGARIERKWTLKSSKIESLINDLKQNLEVDRIPVMARDSIVPGRRNITQTTYLEKFELDLKSSDLKVAPDFNRTSVSFKTRIRKYGTIHDNQKIALENVELSAFTRDFSFVEFKFSDPRFTGAVFKPRAYMADKFIALLGTSKFLDRFTEVSSETLALRENVANRESVEAMFEFLKLGHEKSFKFRPLAVNLYERTSYAINFMDNSKGGSPFQIQMTLDKSIAFYMSGLNKTIQAYKEGDSVVEVKIPVEYAHYSLSSNLSQIPGYGSFLQFLLNVKSFHEPAYMEGVGKMGHGHRQYLQEQGF